MSFKRITLISLCALWLSACGQGSKLPAALQPVSDEPGQVHGLRQMPRTLYQALLENQVPPAAAKEALLKYDVFADKIKNTAYFVIIDMTQMSNQKRFYMINKASGAIDAMEVAHGAGSDPQNTGWAKYFSNIPDSKMTSLGAYLIADRYTGKHGPSLHLDGLEATNSNARARDIVLHQAPYVHEGNNKQGRSWGCPAVPSNWISTVLQRLEGGAFMYIYGMNQAKNLFEPEQLERWNLLPKELWPSESENAPDGGA